MADPSQTISTRWEAHPMHPTTYNVKWHCHMPHKMYKYNKSRLWFIIRMTDTWHVKCCIIIIMIISLLCQSSASLEWWAAGVVIYLERCADLHMAQLTTLPLTVSCFSTIQIGFTFLVLAHPGSPRKRAGVCVVNPRRITALMLPKLWHQQLLISSCCTHPGCGIWQTSINSQ